MTLGGMLLGIIVSLALGWIVSRFFDEAQDTPPASDGSSQAIRDLQRRVELLEAGRPVPRVTTEVGGDDIGDFRRRLVRVEAHVFRQVMAPRVEQVPIILRDVKTVGGLKIVTFSGETIDAEQEGGIEVGEAIRQHLTGRISDQ